MDLDKHEKDTKRYLDEWIADSYGKISGRKMNRIWECARLAARFPAGVQCSMLDFLGIFVHTKDKRSGINVYITGGLHTAVFVPGHGEIDGIDWDSTSKMLEYVDATLHTKPGVKELQNAVKNMEPTLTGWLFQIDETLTMIASVTNGTYTTTIVSNGKSPRGSVVHADLDSLVLYVAKHQPRVTPVRSKSAKAKARKMAATRRWASETCPGL
jgi:hypothetical protein